MYDVDDLLRDIVQDFVERGKTYLPKYSDTELEAIIEELPAVRRVRDGTITVQECEHDNCESR